MVEFAVKVLINAAAVWAAVKLVPQISFHYGSEWWKLIAVALIVALVNTFIRPIVTILSFPVSIKTLGLVSFVINAALLLLVAVISDELKLGFRIGGFPASLTADAFVGALLGSIVISIVATLLGLVNFGRRAIGLR